MTAKKSKDLKLAARILRYIEFLTVSLVLRWPIWILLAVLKPLKIFKYLFMVYPGTDSDLDGYCPRRLAKSWVFSKQPTIGGIISKGSGNSRGLVLVVPNTTDEFESQKDVCDKVTKRLAWIQRISGAKSIALAGRLPSIISRNGDSFKEPFVKGNKGTVFCIMETISEAMQIHGFNVDSAKIAIVGVGYVGKLLIDALKAENYKVTGIDIQGDGEILREADIVVVLTPRGQDFVPYVKYLKKDAVIIDDTHPKITEQPPGMTFYKVAVGMERVKFHPRLPGYKQDWIPGCAVEAMVAAATGDFNGTRQEEFDRRAKELGFFARMVR